MLDKDWQIWHFNTSTHWDSIKDELPYVDISEVYQLNTKIFQMIFMLKLDIKKYVSGEHYHRSVDFFDDLEEQIQEIRLNLDLKEELLLAVDESKIEELRFNHKEFNQLADELLVSLSKGLNNKAFVDACGLIEVFVKHVTEFDTKVFSVKEIISSVDPYNVKDFNKLVSFATVPNVFLVQVNFVKNLIDFNIVLTRYADDFFMIEEKFSVLLKIFGHMLQSELSFVDRFYDQKSLDEFKLKQIDLRRGFREVADRILRRDLPTVNDFLINNVAKVIEYINRDSYRVIRPDKIKLKFLENIDSFDEIKEIFEGMSDIKIIAKLYNEVVGLFKTSEIKFQIILDDVFNKFSNQSSIIGDLNINPIAAQDFQEELKQLARIYEQEKEGVSEKGRILYKLTLMLIEGQCGKIENIL